MKNKLWRVLNYKGYSSMAVDVRERSERLIYEKEYMVWIRK